jgi:acyl-CoA thioesterase-2
VDTQNDVPEPFVGIDQLLELSTVSEDSFTGPAVIDGAGRLFGGHAIAQTIKAATSTVSGQTLRSIQLTFMRAGRENTPLELLVSRPHSGRRMSTRLIHGHQDSRHLFTGLALFNAEQLPGTVAVEHDDYRAEGLVLPEALPPALEYHIGLGATVPNSTVPKYLRTGLRFVDAPPRVARILDEQPSRSRAWFDLRNVDVVNLPAALGYVSDLALLDPLAIRHRLVWQESATPATLTHSMTIHHPDLLADNLLFDRISPTATGGTGFVTCAVFNRAGIRVATVTQDAILLEP